MELTGWGDIQGLSTCISACQSRWVRHKVCLKAQGSAQPQVIQPQPQPQPRVRTSFSQRLDQAAYGNTSVLPTRAVAVLGGPRWLVRHRASWCRTPRSYQEVRLFRPGLSRSRKREQSLLNAHLSVSAGLEKPQPCNGYRASALPATDGHQPSS